MNAGERAHWLEPSPPIAVDGDDPRTDPPAEMPEPEAETTPPERPLRFIAQDEPAAHE